MAIGVPRGRHALTISIVFTCLSTLFSALRIFTRVFIVKQMGADDWTILVSLAFSWAFFGVFLGETVNLMGEPLANIPPETLTKQLIFFWASVPLYQTSLITTKASLLLQYKQVFPTHRMRQACYSLIEFLTVYGTWTIVSAWLNCIPVAKFWDDSLGGYCLNQKALWFSNSAIHILTDIMILIYPLPVLKDLQLPYRQKAALIVVFTLGSFVFVTSILRLQSLLVISNSTDPTYDNVGAATWSAIECNVAIICACLPANCALVTRLMPHILSTRSNGYRSTGRNGLSQSRFVNKTNIKTAGSMYGAQEDHHMQSISHGPEQTENGTSLGKNIYTPLSTIKVMTSVPHEFSSSVPDDCASLGSRSFILGILDFMRRKSPEEDRKGQDHDLPRLHLVAVQNVDASRKVIADSLPRYRRASANTTNGWHGKNIIHIIFKAPSRP
ncbi:hypothetical protein BBP40_008489 [Aspergillus hancockii]|nr:hypothetical protein BBP40_008489 [Aspergillus hancockii]